MNIVLINPEIPFNTGNIGRTCVATNSVLHLVGKLGFKLDEKEIRRSGLDYWPKLNYKRHMCFEDFLATVKDPSRLFFFSTKATKNLWDIKFKADDYLVFGSESCGLPKELYKIYKDQLYKIEQPGPVRSLNLSTSAAVCLYEALRQTLHK
jgi:Predicted rRNA methylase (SpoU class)